MGLKMALKKYVETHGTHSLSIFYLRKKKKWQGGNVQCSERGESNMGKMFEYESQH